MRQFHGLTLIWLYFWNHSLTHTNQLDSKWRVKKEHWRRTCTWLFEFSPEINKKNRIQSNLIRWEQSIFYFSSVVFLNFNSNCLSSDDDITTAKCYLTSMYGLSKCYRHATSYLLRCYIAYDGQIKTQRQCIRAKWSSLNARINN